MQVKKIVIIGPESTGKSSLCEKLALHYHTRWVPEFARSYLLENGMKYTEADLLKIAKGQLALEDQYMHSIQRQHPAPRVLFIDTNMYVMKVWSDFVFKKSDPWIIEQLTLRKYDLYLLCNIDLPWVQDELREYPDIQTRKRLYDIYSGLLESQRTPWTAISGNYEERLKKAISAVDMLLEHGHPDKHSFK